MHVLSYHVSENRIALVIAMWAFLMILQRIALKFADPLIW